MRHAVTFAVRQLIRQPGLSAAAVGTLGLGLAASLAVFTLLNAVLLRPLPYPESERVMALGRGPAENRQASSHRDVAFLRDHIKTCAPIAATVSGSGLNVELGGATSYSDDVLVSHQYFEAVGIQPTWGRAFTAAEDAPVPAPVVVLNERFVRQMQLDPAAVVGREIRLGGRPHTVIGVLAARYTRPFDADVYRPLGNDARGNGQNMSAVCRLTAGSTPAALDAEFAALVGAARAARLIGDSESIAYSAISRHEWEFGSYRPQINTLLFAVGLVLLVAAANTTGLLLVRAAGRRREMAIRTALGEPAGHLARTLIVESLALSAIAGAVGLAAAPLMLRGLLAVAPAYYTELATFSIDGTVVAVAVALCVVVGLAVALAPLAELLRVNVRDTLQEEGRSGTQGRRTTWLRHLLIGAETALCAVLLVGALLLLRTFVNLTGVDTGVDSSGVITARISIQGPQYDDVSRLVSFFEEAVRRLEQSPAVDGAAAGASLPAERALNLPATFPDTAEPNRVHIVNWRHVTPGYFPLLKLRIVAGRTLEETDRIGAPSVALVNDTFAKSNYGSAAAALGRRISVRGQPAREIVGVVSDTRGWSLADPARPMMFVPLAQVEASLARTAHSFFPPRFIVRARDAAAARRELESVVRQLDPSQPFIEIQTLDALMLKSVAMQRFYLVVLSAFALFAVSLAAVGIYATYSYLLATRRTEIGVRLALGARPGSILATIIGRSLLLGGAATTIGLAIAAAASRVLKSVLYEVSETDPSTYVAVGVVLLAVVAVATVLPAFRAARTDPLTAMRG